MIKVSLRVYLTANVIVSLFFLLMGFELPDSLIIPLVAFLYSLLFSLPALLLLVAIFWLIKFSGFKTIAAWITLSVATGLIALVPVVFLSEIHLIGSDSDLFIGMAFISAYFAILINYSSINHLFNSFTHEIE